MKRILPGFAAAVPCVTLALCSIWWTAAKPFNGGLWPADPMTLPEAVLARNSAEVVRQLEAGGDSNRHDWVRPRFLSSENPVSMTALDAAVWAREPGLVHLVLAHGAAADPPTLVTLRCLNERHPDAGVRELLEQLSPAPWPDCSAVRVPGYN